MCTLELPDVKTKLTRWATIAQFKSFNLHYAVYHIWFAENEKPDDTEDLEKAVSHLQSEIERRKGKLKNGSST